MVDEDITTNKGRKTKHTQNGRESNSDTHQKLKPAEEITRLRV